MGSRVGTDFTLISWFALVTWGASGYWLLQRGDWDDFRSPHTLFIRRDLLDSGFGWMLDTYRGLKRQHHTGSTIGFRTAVQRFPEKRFTVTVLVNRANASPWDTAEKIADLYLFQ